MLSFQCDYNNGVHPEILRRLTETNEELLPGYGDDKYSVSAKEKIKLACNKKDADFSAPSWRIYLICFSLLLLLFPMKKCYQLTSVIRRGCCLCRYGTHQLS